MADPFLQGQVALVTGAGVRVGRALALALAEQGATVALHYNHSVDDANHVVDMIHEQGDQARAFQADLADDAQTVALIPTINRELGTVRILINSASLFGAGLFKSTTVAEWDENMNVNLRAPFLLSQAFAVQQYGKVEGNIINISDWRGLRPGTDHFAYTISKAALIKMTESMALALAPRIRVNCLALGSILLPQGAPPSMEQQLLATIPLKRMGTPQDVANAVLFLLAPQSFITGQTIVLDGGRELVR